MGAKLCACGPWGLFDVHGQGPADVRTVGFLPCLFHYDPRGWSEMPLPENGTTFGGLWSLSATQILLAGQGGADSESGSIALWGSSDGGHTWKQFSDPAFVGLPRSDMGFFDLAATRGGQRIFGPSLGGTLALGEVGDLCIRVSFRKNRLRTDETLPGPDLDRQIKIPRGGL